MEVNILDKVREAAAKKILYLPHAVSQMSRPDRMIEIDEIEQIINQGELIEDYPNDSRGHSCLLLGAENIIGRPIHVVCSPKDEYLAIITSYLPSGMEWENGYKKRIKS